MTLPSTSQIKEKPSNRYFNLSTAAKSSCSNGRSWLSYLSMCHTGPHLLWPSFLKYCQLPLPSPMLYFSYLNSFPCIAKQTTLRIKKKKKSFLESFVSTLSLQSNISNKFLCTLPPFIPAPNHSAICSNLYSVPGTPLKWHSVKSPVTMMLL